MWWWFWCCLLLVALLVVLVALVVVLLLVVLLWQAVVPMLPPPPLPRDELEGGLAVLLLLGRLRGPGVQLARLKGEVRPRTTRPRGLGRGRGARTKRDAQTTAAARPAECQMNRARRVKTR